MSMDAYMIYDEPPYRIGIPRRRRYYQQPYNPLPAQLDTTPAIGPPVSTPMPVTPAPAPGGTPAPVAAAGDTIFGLPKNYVFIGGAAVAAFLLFKKR